MKYLGNPQSGSQAGTTASHNRAGQYYRNRRAPVQPVGKGRRALIRSYFGNASQAWAALTAPEQASWTAYANSFPVTDSLGQSITLTGQQMFVSINTQAQNTNGVIVTTVPASNAQDDLNPVTINWGTLAAPLIDVGWTAGASANFALIAASAPVSNGVSFMKTFCQLDVEPAAAGSDAILALYTAQFGELVVGQKVFFKITPVNQYFVTGVPIIISSVVARV